VVERAVGADGETVVIKQPAGEFVVVEAVRRVQYEHDLLCLLRGDGVVDTRGIARDGGHIALITESFGSALSTSIADRRFSLGDALDVAIALARTLGRVHAAGVVHKDVNPQNILYDPVTRTTKLIDFDIACWARPGSPELVASTALEGTLGYLAPEQTGRMDRRVDARTDMYSLGLTLYELFTGQRAFEGDDALALVHAHLAQQPPRIDAVDPTIPRVIADIVARLVAKAPEQRYQTATGLGADLERCRRELAAGLIPPFAIGQRDVSSRLEFSARLYGRDAEVRALRAALARTSRGAVETVLVSGYSGVGKSSLVREIYAAVTAACGYVASGKFEQLHRDVPYSAVVAALDELIAQIVADPALDRWRTDIAMALGDDAPLVRSVLPAIERVLGAQPLAAALDPATAQRRLAVALSRLVQVFARKQHPLVVFLDDMQWSDAASLQLLTRLATSDDTEALLIIAAYRDSEVHAAHPFALALRDYEKRGAKISRIKLAPLELSDTAELVADVLRVTPDQVAEAATVIWRKTEGNPFFIRQFLRALHEESYITFDPRANAFTFDASAIERAEITENVADLLAHELGKLPAATRDALVTAAAIGTRFDVATLVTITDSPAAAVQALLAPAVDAGMIVPIAKLAYIAPDVVGCPRYAFQHDRIQQAAYEAAPTAARERLHLEIGRQLLVSCRASSTDDRDARLFDIVHHLSHGRALITEEVELAEFVDLVLVAARRARRSGAYDVAATLLRSACASRSFREHHAVWFEAHVGFAEALSLGGLHADAREIVRIASEHATSRERATLEALDLTICSTQGLMTEAVACGRRAAAILGVELPADLTELAAQTAAELAIIMAAVDAAPVETWLERPAMRDPDKLAAMALFTSWFAAAYQIEPPLMVLICAKLVTLSLQHGNCGASASGYANFSIVLWAMGQYELSFRFAKLGVDLVRQVDDRAIEPGVAFIFAAFASPWRRPLEDSIELLRATVGRAIEAGDLANAGYAAVFAIEYALVRGAPLPEILDEVVRYRALCTRLGLTDVGVWLSWFAWHARSWTGTERGPHEADIDYVATERALATAAGSPTILTIFRLLEVERRYWRGDFAGALELARVVVPFVVTMPGSMFNAEFRLYHCLAAIAVGDTGPDVEAHRRDLVHYAEGCPANFAHMSAVIDGELARSRGDIATAFMRYDAAIDSASEHGFLKVETIAHELAARFWLELHKPAFAAVHLGKARDLCAHWGALPRAHALEQQRRGLGASTDNFTTSHSKSAIASTLDFATVVKASQAIVSDIVLDSLLVKLMEIMIENTGAQTGAIILVSNGELFVHAAKQAGAAVAISGGAPLAGAREMSEAIIKYVTRTAECLVLDDATRHPTFRSDPHVRDRRPRSILCVPIVQKDRVIGAVYLENNLLAGAFTADRLEAVGILVAQLAISIDNAVIFSRLEELVTQRTLALTEANRQLREQAVVRERMESELRLAQKLQSVGQLAAGVAHEINTPIQYVGDSVAFLQDGVASLLGLVDTYRVTAKAAPGTFDVEAIRDAEDDCNIDYLRDNAPEACVRALEGIDRVSKIIRAMKAFAHPDQHDQAPTEINTVLQNTLVVAHSEYREVADVESDFADIPAVCCHAGEVSQVFLNLIINAAHAIEDAVKGTGRRGKISITTRLDGTDAVISIRDTGGGIPDAIRERVFDPFFTTKVVGRGTGQGLALARTAIVDRHGGSIAFETELGSGTTFVVRLPVRGQAVAVLAG